MEFFRNYLVAPSKSAVVNIKILLLTYGLDCNFDSIIKNFPFIKKQYKVNQIRVSDRHLIAPKSKLRNYLPDEIMIADKFIISVVKVYYKKESPFILKAKNKKIYLYIKNSNTKLPVKVNFLKLLNYAKLDYKGYKLSEFISVIGLDRISILPFEGCEHWVIGKQCKFCGANPARIKFREYKPNAYEIKSKFKGDYSEWWKERENFILQATEKASINLLKLDKISPHTHLFILSGGLLDVDYVWEICLKIAKMVNKYLPIRNIDSYINLIPPKNLTLLKKAKEIGFKYVCYNLEVFGEDNFKLVCPGKDIVYGYKEFLKIFEYSVSLFGRGSVRCNFVLGAQPISQLMTGVKSLSKKGIVTDYTVFFPRPGSAWCQRKTPSPSEVINFTRSLIKIYRKYDFKPFCCSLSSRSSIANEIWGTE